MNPISVNSFKILNNISDAKDEIIKKEIQQADRKSMLPPRPGAARSLPRPNALQMNRFSKDLETISNFNEGYGVNESEIITNSEHDPNASWQKSLLIVPFIAGEGEETKVVGDFKKGDNSRFEVINSEGRVYATLKRTSLESGETVWMLPRHASINGGTGSRSNSSRNDGVSYLSDRHLIREAQGMLSLIESMNEPEELDEHAEMLKLMATGEKEPGLVALPQSNVKVTTNGQTVGLMSVAIDMQNKVGTTDADRSSAFWIDKIVTRPDTRGYGKALLTKAINMSEETGHGGVVRAFVQSGHEFYEAMGFREVDGQIQELNPSDSDSWRKKNGVWKFKN